MESCSTAIDEAQSILDDAWAELKRVMVLPSAGLNEVFVPHFSEDEAARRSSLGKTLLARLSSTQPSSLDHDTQVALGVTAEHARRWSTEGKWYYTIFEGGGWFKSMFAPTGDGIGRLVSHVLVELGRIDVRDTVGQDRYTQCVQDLSRAVTQLRDRTSEQAKRGIYMPKVMLPRCRDLLSGLKRQVVQQLLQNASNAPPATKASFRRKMETLAHGPVSSAFDSFSGVVDDDYAARCSERVGISQYPDGEEIYKELIRQNTTLDISAEETHWRGHEEMANVRSAMLEITSREGLGNDVLAYKAQLDNDQAWRRDSAEGIQALFQQYIDRMDGVVRDHFSLLPQAGHATAPLPTALEGTFSYGYYDQPRPDRPIGLYIFNTSNLIPRALVDIAAFTFHELVPGHHLHFATQQENQALHPLQRHTFCNGFNEGWAEYARWYAGQIGMYHHSAEKFGSLFSDARQASRLVVDTGLNVLGWSYDHAMSYLRDTLMQPDAEIQSLINWYACEIPSQSLAYKLGQMEILRLRAKVQAAMGNRFDNKTFHAAVIRNGGRPFHLVEADLDRLIAGA
ncbi:DUF885 domain-containing protein [Bradyrhizobium sp. S3.2.12]|uniref:DUF885 domain-containing protein n=1 Tax=Bradyrhizobium sp. S3.2.12 TaxID=3156387 RepID=UPI00339B7D5E